MNKTMKKIIVSIIGVLVFLLIIFLFMVYWRGSTKDIEAVANRFQPPTSWKLKSKIIHPPAIVCLDGGTCPELSWSWTLQNTLSKEQFINLLEAATWNFPVESDCIPLQNITGPQVETCSAAGTSNGYDIAISILEDSETHQQTAVLDIRPKK